MNPNATWHDLPDAFVRDEARIAQGLGSVCLAEGLSRRLFYQAPSGSIDAQGGVALGAVAGGARWRSSLSLERR